MLAVADLPEAPDLALIAVPAPAVLDVAEDCGRLGVKALAVITSGLDTAACADLLAVCRRHSIRLVGPDSFGIAVPGLGLDATFAASHPRPGVAGLVMQSGGVGLAMVDQLSRLGIGISSFASVGRKLDVSSNDMLLWWEQDEVTKLAVLYIESFGNPRKFARTARRVGARIPVLTVHAGRFAADQDTAASHPAAAALARRVRRPRPGRAPSGRDYRPQAAHAGPRGRGSRRPGGHHGSDIWRSLPAVPGAGRSRRERRRCHRVGPAHRRHRRPGPGHPAGRRQRPYGGRGAEPGRIRAPARRRDPRLRVPRAAAGAIARAATYGAWRAQPRGEVPAFPDVRTADARAIVREYLHTHARGGWLPPGQTADVLRCYGIPLAEATPTADKHTTKVTVRVVHDTGPRLRR